MTHSMLAISLNNSETISYANMVEWKSVQHRSSQWQIVPELENEFFDSDGLKLEEWLQNGQAEIVKTGSHRSVYRLDLFSGTYFLKQNKILGWSARFRSIVRKSKAILEHRAANRIASKGIQTIEPVAVGQTYSGSFMSDSFLISRAIDNTIPLDDFLTGEFQQWPTRRQTIVRQKLANELGFFVARLHASGILHRDFHPGNLLLKLDLNDQPSLSLIDLHPITFHRNIGLQKIQHNLALLNRFFAYCATRSDRVRFFRSYSRYFPISDFSTTVRKLERYCKTDSLRASRKRDRKWSRGNRHQIIANSENVSCRGISQLGKDVVKQLRENPQQLFEDNQSFESYSDSNGVYSEVVQLSITGEQHPCNYTSSISPPNAKKTSSSQQAWETGFAFKRRGINSATPIFFVERKMESHIEEFLLTEAIPPTISLNEFLSSQTTKFPDTNRLFKLASPLVSLAKQLRIIHENGFDHLQLCPEKILISKNSNDEKIWFVGLDAVQQRKRLSRKQRAANLANLNVNLVQNVLVRKTAQLRFLLRYLGQNRDEWKWYWRKIEQLSNQLAAGKANAEHQQGSIKHLEKVSQAHSSKAV